MGEQSAVCGPGRLVAFGPIRSVYGNLQVVHRIPEIIAGAFFCELPDFALEHR